MSEENNPLIKTFLDACKPQENKGVPYSGNIMYPPRPSRKLPPEKLIDYEGKNWCAQRKFNGTRTLVELTPGAPPKLWTRQLTSHRAYNLTPAMKFALQNLHEVLGEKECHVLDAELMNNKTKGLKDRLIIFDILVHNSKHLVGTTMMERYVLLDQEVFQCENDEMENETGRKIAMAANSHIWFAETRMMDFVSFYKQCIEMDEIEGLILKKIDGKLERSYVADNNSSWQIRVRKPNKNYAF